MEIMESHSIDNSLGTIWLKSNVVGAAVVAAVVKRKLWSMRIISHMLMGRDVFAVM
jgi:hypothetical protein